jgi:serine/threonine protein kinase
MAKRKKVFETATNAYTAQSVIGNGGAGTVHLVTDVNGLQFALKCLREADSEKRQRFRNELFFCQQDVHENIVRVLDSGIIAEGSQRLPEDSGEAER